MAYTLEEVMARSGLAARTLRSYAMQGVLPYADRRGRGATYGHEHMVRAVTIGRMRKQGKWLPKILEETDDWKLSDFERFVAQTDPPPPPAPAPTEVPAPAPLIAGAPLPRAAAWSVYELLPGLALVVDTGAADVVRRVAGEILARYRAKQGD